MADHFDFARSENIKHLRILIEAEHDPERRRWLESRLEEEQAGVISIDDRRNAPSGRPEEDAP